MKKLKRFTLTILSSLPLSRAHAAPGWEKDIVDFADVLNSGMVQIAIPVIGFAIIAYGFYLLFSGEFNKKIAGCIIFGGACITIGPATLKAMYE